MTDPEKDPVSPLLVLNRNADLFARRRDFTDQLAGRARVIKLAPDQILHPEVPREFLVRLGKLRISQFFEDGREVTRAVLQAGAVLRTELPGTGTEPTGPAPAADVYRLDSVVLMALGEVDLWSLEPGSLPDDM